MQAFLQYIEALTQNDRTQITEHECSVYIQNGVAVALLLQHTLTEHECSVYIQNGVAVALLLQYTLTEHECSVYFQNGVAVALLLQYTLTEHECSVYFQVELLQFRYLSGYTCKKQY
jgi:hypothetical protein